MIEAKAFTRGGTQRGERGFNRSELQKAGTSVPEAVKLAIPIDSKRPPAQVNNVAAIRTFLASKKSKKSKSNS